MDKWYKNRDNAFGKYLNKDFNPQKLRRTVLNWAAFGSMRKYKAGKQKPLPKYTLKRLDKGIKQAVIILNNHRFDTYESCQGGKGHAYPEPTIRFHGTEFDLIKAYEVCKAYGLNVFEVKRVYGKEDIFKGNDDIRCKRIGETWCEPTNEITFCIHQETGTIFLP